MNTFTQRQQADILAVQRHSVRIARENLVRHAKPFCSQCGGEFRTAKQGFSSCIGHLIECRLSGQISDAQWEQHCGDTEGLREQFAADAARRTQVRAEHRLVEQQVNQPFGGAA